ncbi:MAG: hydrogenase maturation nickel metallochaperone HypA [Zoogloea oleivorans]|jgi:hydrogenase nickel incorporation protein HypA/HybF|uniref:Hydrogenase maturation factor HypA n=1 Tax=Zoogloea oleivorans TaxID=1552750 RepID=A0A6C2CQ41_9RHOO|nr:hydrogenase maturation nickel metallochaperone HypA [Zoogloea oleivorans]MBP8134382.1 hydrogenase maturation nickel metallochaperone HypA [Zoogloea sp.]MDY0034639.1 hydrogenase maturation nickel metallochaperone HypA [Zoogloea oleivorans]TYC55951.1 hydrogenase maturation nickel metallochaperone HypA [Zoogloea oleivorans]
MHEMSLAEGIRQIVEDAGRSQGFGKVKIVVLEIGELSSVEPESLRFCFDVVMKDSIADGAQLQIDPVPGSGWCMQCAETVPISALYDPCPKCGSYQVQATSGTEMRVKELEIE